MDWTWVNPASFSVERERIYSELKWPQLEANHLIPFRAQINNIGIENSSSLYIFMTPKVTILPLFWRGCLSKKSICLYLILFCPRWVWTRVGWRADTRISKGGSLFIYKYYRGHKFQLVCLGYPWLKARSANPCSDPASRIFAWLYSVTAHKVRYLNAQCKRMKLCCPLSPHPPLDVIFMGYLQVLRIGLNSVWPVASLVTSLCHNVESRSSGCS